MSKAFLFSHTRSDVNSPGGKLTVMILSVADSFDDAIALAGEILPEQGLYLEDEGANAQAMADRMKVAPGTAHVL
jgi:hypothetical protein